MAYIIMSDSFERLCEITSHKSILWHPLYLDPTGGDFQLQLDADRYLPHVRKGYYVINTDSRKFGIIDTYEVQETEEGLVLTVSGLMGESILQRRVIWPTISMTGAVDDVVGAIIRMNVTAPANQSRQIANFVYESDTAFSLRVSKQITGATVADAVVSIVGQFGWSYEVVINDAWDGFTMRLISGKDRSTQQTENPVVLFSSADFGLKEFTYLTSEKAVFSHVICAGEGSGASRTAVVYPPTSTDATKGLNRREVFLDKKDLSRDAGEGGTLTEESYQEKLEYEAAEKLKESATSEACEGIVRPYRYRLYKDFDTGDIVSVRNERLGLEYDIRVLGALISIDENGASDITVEMGNLIVSVIQDPPEEDVIEEEPQEPVIDPTTVYLMDDIRPFSFSGSTLQEVSETGASATAKGLPTGWVHIYDNRKAEIVLSAATRYCIAGSGTQSLGAITFTLTPDQFTIAGAALERELDGLSFPVFVTSDAGIETGAVSLAFRSATYGEDNGTGQYTIVCDTELTMCNFDGIFSLLINGIRAVDVPEVEPLNGLKWDISADGDGSVMAQIDAYDVGLATRLVISGSSAIKDFTADDPAPWYGCANRLAVTIEDGVSRIGARTFEMANVLSINLPSSVRSIGARAFYGTSDLYKVTMGNAVTLIDANAFQASGLQEINLSEGLYTIQSGAFIGTKLRTVTIPAKCSYVGASCFQLCQNMETLYIERASGSVFTAGTSAFDFQADAAEIYVHGEDISAAIAGKYDEDVTTIVYY